MSASVVFHFRAADWPWSMVAGVAVKKLIVGAFVFRTVTVTLSLTDLAALVTFSV